MEDRSVVVVENMSFVKGTPTRNAFEPLETLSGTHLSLCLFSWSCGGQECPDGLPDGSYGPNGS